jgi:hypothetical protein
MCYVISFQTGQKKSSTLTSKALGLDVSVERKGAVTSISSKGKSHAIKESYHLNKRGLIESI